MMCSALCNNVSPVRGKSQTVKMHQHAFMLTLHQHSFMLTMRRKFTLSQPRPKTQLFADHSSRARATAVLVKASLQKSHTSMNENTHHKHDAQGALAGSGDWCMGTAHAPSLSLNSASRKFGSNTLASARSSSRSNTLQLLASTSAAC